MREFANAFVTRLLWMGPDAHPDCPGNANYYWSGPGGVNTNIVGCPIRGVQWELVTNKNPGAWVSSWARNDHDNWVPWGDTNYALNTQNCLYLCDIHPNKCIYLDLQLSVDNRALSLAREPQYCLNEEFIIICWLNSYNLRDHQLSPWY